MQFVLLGTAVFAGCAVIVSLWHLNPAFAVLCAPFIASVITGLAAIGGAALPRRTRRHGIARYSPLAS